MWVTYTGKWGRCVYNTDMRPTLYNRIKYHLADMWMEIVRSL